MRTVAWIIVECGIASELHVPTFHGDKYLDLVWGNGCASKRGKETVVHARPPPLHVGPKKQEGYLSLVMVALAEVFGRVRTKDHGG